MTIDDELLEVAFSWEALDGCPLCQGTVMLPNGRVRWLDIDFWYVICPACNLKFMNPRPTQKSYQLFYKTYFWQQKVRNIGFRQDRQMWNAKPYESDNDQVWDPEEGRRVKMAKARTMRTPVIIEPGFSISLWYRNPSDQFSRLDCAGSDVRTPRRRVTPSG